MLLLPEKQKDEVGGPSRKRCFFSEIGQHLIEQFFNLAFKMLSPLLSY